jgi:hypothetical protein
MCSVSFKKPTGKQAIYFNNCFIEQQFLSAARNKLASQQVLVVPKGSQAFKVLIFICDIVLSRSMGGCLTMKEHA